jgi:hypothetical protein
LGGYKQQAGCQFGMEARYRPAGFCRPSPQTLTPLTPLTPLAL